MKALVSALALLVGSNVMAAAADQTLKFKLVTFYADQEDGEYHFDQGLLRQGGSKRQRRRTQHVLFPRRLYRGERSFVDTETQTGGHVVGKIQIVSGTRVSGRGRRRLVDGDRGDKSRSRARRFTTSNWT